MMSYLTSIKAFLIITATSVLLPRSVFSQPAEEPPLPTPQPSEDPVIPTPQPSQSPGSNSLVNPLEGSGVDSVEGFLRVLLDILVIILTPIVVIFIILAGFKYVTAQGDTSKLEEAKRALVYALIGGVLVIGAAAIAEIIEGTVRSFQ